MFEKYFFGSKIFFWTQNTFLFVCFENFFYIFLIGQLRFCLMKYYLLPKNISNFPFNWKKILIK